MKLEVKIELLKFFSAVFNSVFLALGLSVAGCGIWILFGDSSFLGVDSSYDLQVVAVGLLAIGSVVAALSVVGCVGASCENRFLLALYMSFLIVLVLGQMFVTLLLLVKKGEVETSLKAAVNETIIQYGVDRDVQDRLLDNMQRYGGCCGLEGPADWLENLYISSLNQNSAVVPDVLPCSCFRSSLPVADSPWCSELLPGRGNGTFTEGCSKSLSDWLQENSLTIVGMDAGLILIQVLQFVVAVFLYQSFGHKVALVDRRGPAHSQDELDHGEDNYAYADQDSYFVDPRQPPCPPDQHYQDYQELPRGF